LYSIIILPENYQLPLPFSWLIVLVSPTQPSANMHGTHLQRTLVRVLILRK